MASSKAQHKGVKKGRKYGRSARRRGGRSCPTGSRPTRRDAGSAIGTHTPAPIRSRSQNEEPSTSRGRSRASLRIGESYAVSSRIRLAGELVVGRAGVARRN